MMIHHLIRLVVVLSMGLIVASRQDPFRASPPSDDAFETKPPQQQYHISSSAQALVETLQKGGATTTTKSFRTVRIRRHRSPYIIHPSSSIRSTRSSTLVRPPPLFQERYYYNQTLTRHYCGSEGRVETKSVPFERTIQQPELTKVTAPISTKLSRVDLAVSAIYFCNAFCITLPILLTPLIAQKHLLGGTSTTQFCAKVASVGIMGGGIGKLVNGIVCQRLGGMRTAAGCLLGLGMCTFALSAVQSTTFVPWLVAGMEFCSSAMWVASSLLLSQHHGVGGRGDSTNSLQSFAKGITCLSLSSTTGQMVAKTVGSMLLLRQGSWRSMARLGATLTVLCGVLLVGVDRWQHQQRGRQPDSQQNTQTTTSPTALASSRIRSGDDGGVGSSGSTLTRQIQTVVGNPLFWILSVAHVSGYLARTCDRMMGPFLTHVSGLSHQLCGGLTSFVTLGFAVGVLKAQTFFRLDSLPLQLKTLQRWYAQAGLSLVGLVLVSTSLVRSMLPPMAIAASVVVLSFLFASSVAFQFFQLPQLVSSSTALFDDSKAVCLAFMDGIGFFLTAPLWAASSRILGNSNSSRSLCWSHTWTFLAVVFWLSSRLMVHAIQPILRLRQEEKGQFDTAA